MDRRKLESRERGMISGGSRSPFLHFSIILIALIAAGCGGQGPSLQRFPTVPYSIELAMTETAAPAATNRAQSSPTPVVTARPALVLPDPTGASIACAANTLVVSVPDASEDQPAVLTRIDASGEWLYLLMNGGLYRTKAITVDAGLAEISPVLLPGQIVAGRPVQELVDVLVDTQTRFVYVLDKVGHIFRWEPGAELAALAHRASSLADEPEGLPYNVLSISLTSGGNLIMLDATHGELWTTQGLEGFFPLNQSDSLTESYESAALDGSVFYMTNLGEIRTATKLVGSNDWRASDQVGLGLSLRFSNHLGVPMLLLIDALKREITGFDPVTRNTQVRYLFDIESLEMGLLRDAALTNGRMYAIADNSLYVYPGPAQGDGQCEAPTYTQLPRPKLYGVDLMELTSDFIYPIQGGTLPWLPRLFPGAARLYRMGVHHGLDIYGINGPRGFDEGYPVRAVANGRVSEASIDYVDMTTEQFEGLLAQSEAEGQTPPDVLNRLEGRRVVIDHGNGITTVYAHLASITPGVQPGVRINSGDTIGAVGVSGTSAEGDPGTESPHLHFEIWVNDRYLGYGMTVRETMWWFEQIFSAWLA